MSEHAWVQENVAAYLAGGLDAQEAERLEAHARDCPACGELLGAARQFDTGLSGLFADARPTLGLEDRAVARLRTPPTGWRLTPRGKWAVAVAATLLLGVIGAAAGSLASNDGLRIEGPPQIMFARKESAEHTAGEAATTEKRGEDAIAQFSSALIYGADDDRTKQPSGEGYGPWNGVGLFREPLGTYTGDINNRLDKQTVDSAVTGDNIGKPNAADPDTTVLAAPELSPKDLAAALRGYGHASTIYAPKTAAQSSMGYTPPGRPDPSYPVFVDPTGLRPAFDPTSLRPAATEPMAPQPKADPEKPEPPKNPTADPKNPAPNTEPFRRIVIRSGDVEFEIASYDDATETVTTLVRGVKDAFVAGINSDKTPSGKIRGSITVRMPPNQLDGFIMDLRRELGKTGELKGVKLSSQDVTKTYTDLESNLRAARLVEERLLAIIKEGKGEIKQILEAEQQLAVWRTKIESLEGEIRYYANLAAFSTLNVVLTEKEVRAAVAVTERERVQAGVEVEDVDKAYQQVLSAVVEAKGRILKSELKQLSAGQFNATFNFEVAADSSGPIRDRLRMLGRVARLEIDRAVQTESGATPPPDAKPTRGDTVFLVQLYNLANVAPREAALLHVAATDVPAAYQALRDAVAKTTGRVLVAQLNEQDRQNITAQLDFEVRRSEEGAVRAALEAAGEVLSRQVGRAAESDSVTDTKVLYRVTLLSANRLKPRETTTLSVEVKDVDGTAAAFNAQVAEVKGRQVDAKLDRDAGGKATAKLVFEVPLSAAPALIEKFKSAGTVRLAQSARNPQATDGKYAIAQLHVTVTNVESIVPEGAGLWPKVRQGLSLSASVLLTSVTWVVFGLCVVLPWAAVGLGGYRVVRHFVQPAAPAAAPATPAPTTPDAPPPTPA